MITLTLHSCLCLLDPLRPFVPTCTLCTHSQPFKQGTATPAFHAHFCTSHLLASGLALHTCSCPLSSFTPNIALCTHLDLLMPACTCSCPSHLLAAFRPFILTPTCSWPNLIISSLYILCWSNCSLSSISWPYLNVFSCNLHNKSYLSETIETRHSNPIILTTTAHYQQYHDQFSTDLLASFTTDIIFARQLKQGAAILKLPIIINILINS